MERPQIQLSNEAKLSAGQISLVEPEDSPYVLVGEFCCAQNWFILVLAQSKRVQSLTLDDELLLFAPICYAPELHLELFFVIRVHHR